MMKRPRLENFDDVEVPINIPEDVRKFIEDVFKYAPLENAPDWVTDRVDSAWSMFQELANPLFYRAKDGYLPDTPQKAAKFIISHLHKFDIDPDIKKLLTHYGLPRPTKTEFKVLYDEFAFPSHDHSELKFETFVVKKKEIAKGDTFDVWVRVKENSQVPAYILRSMAIYNGIVQKTESEEYLGGKVEAKGYRYLRSTEGLARRLTIQLRGVRAHKLQEGYGVEAKAELVKAISDRCLMISVHKVDQHLGCIADAYVDNVLVQKTLLEKGAVWYCDDDGKNEEFDKLQKSAEASEVGLWSQKSPQVNKRQ